MSDTPARRSLIDRVIEAVAPVSAVRREMARLTLQQARAVTARYEGASRGHRMNGKLWSSRSADGVSAGSIERLRNVARDLERNSPYVQRGLTVIPTAMIGAGVVPSVQASSPRAKKAIEALVKSHLETTGIDFDGRHNLYGLQFLACRAMARDGEVLVVRMQPKASLGLSVPLQLRVLEADYLDTLKDGPVDGGWCVQGVEYDASGRRVAYHLFDKHPGDISMRATRRGDAKRVAAEDVIHLYRTDRPGQTRGVTWLAPAIVTINDLKDYEEAELVRQRVAACFSAFVAGAPYGNAGAAAAGAADRQGRKIDVLGPGTIQHLAEGETVTFATPPQVQGYAEFVRMNLRKFASALGVPFNEIASDDSQENFSSSRRGYLVYQRLIDVWRWQTFIPQFCDRVAGWFLDAATIPLRGVPNATMAWSPPKRELISPKEEVAVMRDMVRGGFSSRSEQIRSLGYEPAAIDDDIAADNTRADEKKLVFDSDGRNPINGPSQAQGRTQGQAQGASNG
jgi:lambda family phage portal protein